MFISGLAGILAATGRDLNATTVLVTGRTVFDFLANIQGVIAMAAGSNYCGRVSNREEVIR
ncbi:MAG TPA: hypothetical protein DCE43_20055 [Planctomycetaceae bacterium]|nr:hypothetical protein [Planctomycetaceae bacterium]